MHTPKTVSSRFPKPEVMSPAGHWEQLHTAIEAGADAVYFGLHHFTARAKVGFHLAELPNVMRTLHGRGVKGYLTFNTLVFDHELGEAAKALAKIAEAGTDAVIVQDIGMAQLAHRIAPQLQVHGSTQMSITSAEGVELARQLGVSRVVLARELSLQDIRAIREQTDCELEMFVHGALCVSYSGQCFSSEAWGGRSANRGQCAQACRLPYEMYVDGKHKPLGEARYLLSPEDLYALPEMPEIITLGISSLKIEGRYKEPNYVALTTAAYRKAVDEAWAGKKLSISPAEELQLMQVYSRGLGAHFVSGTNHQTVVNGRSPRHRGVLMGRVTRVDADKQVIVIAPEAAHAIAPLKAGDGVVLDAAHWRSPQEKEEGGRVYEIRNGSRKELELRFANNALNFSRIRTGDWLWRSHDPDLDKVAKPFTHAETPLSKQTIHAKVVAHEGQALHLTLWLAAQPAMRVAVQSNQKLGVAKLRGVSVDGLREPLGRLGNTPYLLGDIELDLRGNPFAPVSLINDLRREAVEQLIQKQQAAPAREIAEPLQVLRETLGTHTKNKLASRAPQLHVLVRTPEQLDAALALRPHSITLDYLELYGLRPAVERVQAAGITARVASPRILKPNEQRVVNFLTKLDCEIVVRSAGLLQALAVASTPALIGDFSLNAANVLTTRTLLGLGLSRITPTHDLNAAQMCELAQQIGGDLIEVIVYQHLPIFHTEHCVFCRFLSSGTTYKDCGHPCEKHKVALKDVNGRAHPVMADVGCRNTVFGAEAQEASAHLDALRHAGIAHFRLEFVHESGEQVTNVVHAFQRALAGEMSAKELGKHLRQAAPQGTTEGSLFVPDDYLRVPMV